MVTMDSKINKKAMKNLAFEGLNLMIRNLARYNKINM